MTFGLLDLLTLVVFCLASLVGWLMLKIYERRHQSQQQRVQAQLSLMLDLPLLDDSTLAETSEGALFHSQQVQGVFATWYAARRRRLKTVCCGRDKTFAITMVVLSLLALIALIWLLPMDRWWSPLLLALTPLLVLMLGYRFMVQRFKKRFLAQFPNALDLIIRAVRAGVPANQAISAASKEFPDPLGTEFGLMGDGLRLGFDLKQVLEEADKRMDIAEFSFFCVCLLLQRETGGPLTETLENLAQIIRSRTELALKAKALTAETRAASKIIAVIPALVILLLWLLNRDYIITLFTTSGGLLLLKLAIALVVIGLAIINHLSNLKV